MNEDFTVVGVHDGKRYIAERVLLDGRTMFLVGKAKTLFGFTYGKEEEVELYTNTEFHSKFTGEV